MTVVFVAPSRSTWAARWPMSRVATIGKGTSAGAKVGSTPCASIPSEPPRFSMK
jgi:hypothetical protein